MAHTVLTDEQENSIRTDCNKLFDVLKNCDNPDESKETEGITILYRIVFLISYRQSSKMMGITSFTVRYLCQHPMLPTILVEILRESHNIKICACVLEILAKLVIKNASTAENDRKTCRRAFSDPVNFKAIVDAFQKVYAHFIRDKTNPLFYELQLRLLKIINCLYVRKGQTQISALNEPSVEFIGRHLTKYKAHKDISQSVLPLVKLLCRNKKYCALMCNDNFLTSLATVVHATNKYPTATTILKLMSRSPEAVQEMSTSEKTFHFILTTAICHADKAINKKHLMTTLYRMTKSYNGVQNISKPYLWLLLLDFLTKLERFEEVRQRLAATKALTVLLRGVHNESVPITPLQLDLKMSQEIQNHIAEKSNHHSDDSDNEESEDEDEGKQRERARTSSEENDESEESEAESDEDNEGQVEEKPVTQKIVYENTQYMKPYFCELFGGSPQPPKLKIFQSSRPEDSVHRNKNINRQAYPDAVFADSDKADNCNITSNINLFSLEEMMHKAKVLKGIEEERFKRRTVFDLDSLIDDKNGSVDVPGPGWLGQTAPTSADVEQVHNKNGCLVKQNSTRSIKCKRGPPTLQFESRFECGNLRKVDQVGDYEYNLFLSPDINMTNGLQWFYFQVANMLTTEPYTFNIVNFQKVNSQFNYGLQPVMFSLTDHVMHSAGWKKIGEKIVYYGNEFVNEYNEKQFRTLSFSTSFPHANDYCYFAYHFPYTYTRLMFSLLPFLTVSDNILSRADKLTDTVNGFNEVPLLTITAASNASRIPFEKRPLVFLTARVHPGESNASWIMDGILQFLLDQQDDRAIKARQHYIFKIIPMLNPEGVIYGNTRCGLTGNDLNRCWKKPHPVLHPEIYYAKKLVQFAKEQLGHPIFTFIDIHGHSRKKFFFLYGCNPKQSWNDIDKSLADSSDFSYNLLPKALSVNENMKMSFCRYTIEKKREATCRVVMWREFGIKCSYTLECSFCSGENKKKVTTKMLRDIGISIIASLTSIAQTA